MNSASPKSYIHYDPERIDFSLTGEELETLKHSSQNSWKDFFIGSFAVGIPCLLNAISEINKQQTFTPTLSLNLNLVLGVVGIVLGAAFLTAWRKTVKDVDRLIAKIKSKPKVEMPPTTSEVGELSSGDEPESSSTT